MKDVDNPRSSDNYPLQNNFYYSLCGTNYKNLIPGMKNLRQIF